MKCSRFNGIAKITKIGHACQSSMPWESPYIDFDLYAPGCVTVVDSIRWHSDNIDSILQQQDNLTHSPRFVDCWFDVEILHRNGKVWRIRNIKYR